MKRNFKKAFTLVEMLIVVIIIGILMAALLPRLKGAQERARDTARKANISQISTALEMYFNDNGYYPNGQCVSDLKQALVPQYMSDLPTDPQKGRIAYGTKAGGCEGWVYGYAPLYKNGAQSGWSVLLANVEAEGKVGNFILVSDTNNVDFDSANYTDNKRFGQDVDSNTTSITNNYLDQQDHFSAADIAQNAVCQTTKVTTNINDYGKGCWWPAWQNRTAWQAKSNQTMVYVRFN